MSQQKKRAGTAVKTDPAKWEKAKSDAKARMGGKHSARAMQLATKLYKDRGGGYKGKKKEPDWGEIVREQYVTIEVRDDHAATAARCVILQMQCLTPFADAKLEVALHVFQAHDGRLRAGASLTACSQPALPPGPQPRAQLSGATLAAAGGRATHRALGAAQAGR